MSNLKVSVSGVEKVNARLKKVEEDIAEGVMRELKTIALVDIETVAKQRLTERKHVDTGRLRASIHTEYNGEAEFNGVKGNTYSTPLPKKNQPGSLDGRLSDKAGPFEIFVGTNVEYAKKMERYDAYLFPAFVAAKSKIIAAAGKIVGKITKK